MKKGVDLSDKFNLNASRIPHPAFRIPAFLLKKIQTIYSLHRIFLILTLVLLGSCQKDISFEETADQSLNGQAILRDGSTAGLDPSMIVHWYTTNKPVAPFDINAFNLLSLDPAWLYGFNENIGEVPVYVVPVINDLDSIFPNTAYNLIFSASDSEIVCRLLVFSSKNASTPLIADFELYEGLSFQIAEDNSVGSFHIFKNGLFKHIDLDLLYADSSGIGSDSIGTSIDFRNSPECGDKNQFWRKLGQSWDRFWMKREWNFDNWGGGDWGWTDEGGPVGGPDGNGGYYFMNPLGSGGIGGFGYFGNNPNTNARSYSHLFNNQIFNRGYRELKHCNQVLADDATDDDVADSESSLGILLANGSLSLNQFHLLFTASVDMYIDELAAGENPSLTKILKENLNDINFLFFGVNYHYEYLIPDVGIYASKYVYEKVAACYAYCKNNDGSGELAGIQGAYQQPLCNCMDQFSVEEALIDYLKHYLNSNALSPTEKDNWAILRNLIDGQNIGHQELIQLIFTPCKLKNADFISCISVFFAEKHGVSQELIEYAIPICVDNDLDYNLSDIIGFYNETADWPWPYPNLISKPTVIENGMIVSCQGLEEEPQDIIRRIAYNSPRHESNSEDIQANWGRTNKHFIVDSYKPDSYYESRMRELFWSCSILNSEMSVIGTAFINKFLGMKGTYREYSNFDLNDKISEHPALINYTKAFAKNLNDKLKSVLGNIDQINEFDIDQDVRVRFGTLYDRFNGYQILINDTEQCDISLLNYTYNPNNNQWHAEVYIEIQDNFGLDTEDVLKFQTIRYNGWPILIVEGFPSWWYLQHNRNYSPLKTIIRIKASIIGNLN